MVGLGLSSTLNKWLHFRGRTKVLKPHSASRLYYSDSQLSQSTRTTPLSSSMFIYAVLAQAPLPSPPSPTRAARSECLGPVCHGLSGGRCLLTSVYCVCATGCPDVTFRHCFLTLL